MRRPFPVRRAPRPRPRLCPRGRGELYRLARAALAEDLGRAGDLSTRWFVPPGTRLRGAIVARQAGVVCGLEAARLVFRLAAPGARFTPLARDGDRVRPGSVVARVAGPREVLTAERPALNFLQRLSGIATAARRFADRLAGSKARLYDTRKTLPGWRGLEKYAVRCGGGFNHRMGLGDMVMVKDNHLAALAPGGPGLAGLIARFRRARPGVPVLVEAKTRAQAVLACDAGADIVLLDNMPLRRLGREIRFIRARWPGVLIEASGGIDLDNIAAIARLGPDRISVGSITHSAGALDLSLEIS